MESLPLKFTHHRLGVIPGCLTVLLLILWWLSPAQAQSGITLNLKDADIRTLIETVSEATGRNFVIDPRVKAKVTVVSSQPMNQDEVYQVFLSILQVHGYSAVPVGEVIKIVPDVTAKQGPVDVTSPTNPGTGDELVTRVLHVENVPAAQMVPILRPLVPQQGHLAAYAASNVLVVSDRAGNINRLEQIIRRIDIPDHEQIEIIPLQHASAIELVRIITSLTQKDGKGAQAQGRPILAADDRSNSILLGGDKNSRLRIRGLIAHLDTPVDGGGNTQVVFLKFAQAEELAAILQGVGQHQQQQGKAKGKTTTPSAGAAATSSSSKRKDEIDIQADPLNNALIISAPPDQFKNLRSVIRQLDIRREQVLVESVIAEVETSLAKELGIQFAAIPSENDKGPVVLSNIGGSGKSLTDIVSDPLGIGAGLFLGAADLTEGSTRFAFLLRALSGDTATNILSTPTLVTMDNEEAEIKVGQKVPFRTGSFTTSTSEQTNPFQTIEREDVGLRLTLTPQINEGDTIKLEIEQESSDLVTSALALSAAADLITNQRTIKTSVLVEDDQILVLGGLIQDQFRDTVQKVPLLGDIPILGRLFRFDDTSKEKKNLMVFIHPVILRDEATANIYTNRKYGYMRARQLEADIGNRGLIEDTAARLPDLDDLMTKRPLNGKKDKPNQDVDAFIDLE
jgi:general secretion pathway protein D